MSAEQDTTPRFSYYGRRLSDTEIAALPDSLVCKDESDGALIVHRRTQRIVPVPRKATP